MPKVRKSVSAALEAERINAEKEKQLKEERERNLDRIASETKQQSLRVAILDDSKKVLENLLQKVEEHKKQIKKDDEWSTYIACENMPDTNVPSEIRNFIYKWQTSINEHWDHRINWWLKCDDRSVLTQDLDQKDMRRVLIEKQREPTAKFYDQKLRWILKVYNSLLDTLRRKKMPEKHHEDLITLRDVLRDMMLKFLDVLSLEVSSHVDHEMVSMNALMVFYSFSSPDFIKFIWSFKDVPLPETVENLKLIKMDPLKMNVTVSNLFKLNSSVVRGLWFKYDFYTSYSPSYKPLHEPEFNDLSTAVNTEWNVRKAMVDGHLKEMRKAREAYDQKMEEKRQKEEDEKTKNSRGPKAKAPAKDDKKSPKKTAKKAPKEMLEPPIVDEATYVDVEDEYVAYEDSKVENDRENLSAENLGLCQHEVNMRQHQITSGVHKIECFERPSQSTEVNFKLFQRLDETPNVLKHQEFHHIYEPEKLNAQKDKRKSQVVSKAVDTRLKALRDLMKIEIKLSEKFFWWEIPTVCRWETWDESDEFASMDPILKAFYRHHNANMEKEDEKKLFSAPDPRHYKKKIQLDDFDLTSPPDGLKHSELIKNYVVPMMPDDFKLYEDQLQVFDEKQREWKDMIEAQVDADLRNTTIDHFNKEFAEKSFKARKLFPVEHRKLIEIVESSEMEDEVKIAREKFRKQQKQTDKEDADIGELRPLKDEPLLLSELLKQIESANESLHPIIRQEVREESVELFRKKSTRPKSRLSTVRQTRASAARALRFSQISSKDVPKHRKPKTPSRPSPVKSENSRRSQTSPTTETAERQSTELSSKTSQNMIVPHKGKWSTRDVHEQTYDPATRIVTFYAGRLGTFGFATKKYCNLPLKSWELCPVVDDGADKHVLLKVETQHACIEFKITNNGYKFSIISPITAPFQGIDGSVKLFELKQILSNLNLNLFPEVDAICYVKNNSPKHQPMEFHAYKSMSVYCLSHHFKSSDWNRLAHHRVAIFESRMISENIFKRLMVTPLRTASVDINERLTELEVVKLEYEMNPPEQEFYPDLLSFLNSKVDKREHRANQSNFMVMYFVQALLMNIQPLSFSQ